MLVSYRGIAYKRSTVRKYFLSRIVLLPVFFGLFQYFAILFKLSDLTHQWEQVSIDVTEQCTCVNCDEDEVCGGLWRASRYPGMPPESEVLEKKLHIVISHCKKSLNWMPMLLEGFANIASIHVISKCGVQVEGAPQGAVVEVLPRNVGRNDHAFAYYITSILPKITCHMDSSVVVFLKDTTGEKMVDLKSLVRKASSMNGFACGLGYVSDTLSAYHDATVLSTMRMVSYRKGEIDYNTTDGVPFVGSFETLGNFYDSLNATSSQEIVEVCYGGIFAAYTANIFTRQDMKTWKALEKVLERGDNIEEGHYAERSWARLIATPLKPFQASAIKQYATGVQQGHWDIHGAFIR